MDLGAGGKGSAWKLCIGAAIVCGVLVFTAGFLHRNAVASAIDAQETKSAAYVRGKLTDAVGNDKLTKQLSDRDTAALEKAADVPAGTVVSIYALNGNSVFSTGRATVGDRGAISSASDGDVSRVISGSDLVVYAPIADKGKVVAVGTVSSDLDAVRADAGGPLDAMRLPLVALGVLLLIAGLALMVRGGPTSVAPVAAASAETVPAKQKDKRTEASAKGRISGFEPAPAVAAAPVEAPSRVEAEQPVPVASAEADAPSRGRMSIRFGKKASKETVSQAVPEPAAKQAKVKKPMFGRVAAAEDVAVSTPDPTPDAISSERQASILRLLEDQLEQLRTKIQTQEEAAASATRDLQAQLDAATRRAEEAEARTAGPGGPTSIGPAERDMIERLRSLEAELSQAKDVAAEATARADELQRAIEATPQADATAPDAVPAAELIELRAQVTSAEQRAEEAQRVAAEAEQRAASNESVRGELEVRVAQLGAKAGELEQKATELETRLQEANAGGDAVRAEIATLTASLAASNARVEELEAAATVASSGEEVEATAAEITRLRTELANHMERAQSAEDRVATLEADVLAAEHGVAALVDEASSEERDEAPGEPDEAPRATGQAPTTTVWVAPSASAPVQSEPEPEPAPEPEPEPADSPSPSVWVAPMARTEPESTPAPEAEQDVPSIAEPDAIAPEPQETAAVESGDGFSAVFAAAFGHEVEASTAQSNTSQPNEPVQETVSAPEPAQPAATVPQAPPADDRYGDVWSAAAPEPEPTERSEPSSVEREPADEPGAETAPAVASSLDDDPAPEGDTMSVDDDLWALRARLAHAADDPGPDTNDGPRWS